MLKSPLEVPAELRANDDVHHLVVRCRDDLGVVGDGPDAARLGPDRGPVLVRVVRGVLLPDLMMERN
eukprot:scaffold124417_cov41-Prasinocladus_malaysianus.AAC.1